MRSTWAWVFLFLAGLPAGARQDLQTCGSYPDRGQEELALHRRSRRAQAFKLSAARMAGTPRVSRDIGDLAILEDSDGVISRRNPFNLDRRSVYFAPVNGGAYRYETGESAYDAEAAANGSPLAGLGDDDTREVTLPFAFSYFGRTQTRMFVNSDGNVTFETGDNATAERSLGRVTAGPPRIAPFFADLDPSRVAGGVRVLAQSSRVVVTWLAVPRYSDFNTGPLNTAQLTLFPDGGIQFSYSSVLSPSAVVGIAPGRLAEVSSVVAFSEASDRQFRGAVVERFSDTEEVDIVFAAQKFYETHEDAYDYLAIYNNAGVAAGGSAIAYEVTVRNDRTGIGDAITDVGREYGSPSRLQAVLNLGPLGQYPRSPTGIVPGRATTGDTPLSIIGHEAGHLWLAFASVREPTNIEGRPMLGRQTAHWAFNFNSEASLLEGNRIEDLGPQARPRFRTVATVEGYSALDQYLMGLRAPEEVPPTFVVTSPSIFVSGRPPQRGVTFDGNRRDIGVQELIGVEGRRTPDHTVSQRRFRIAFLLITVAGVEPTADQLEQVDTYRREFVSYFQQVTGGRAEVETSLRRSVQVSLAPAAGVLENATATATVTLARSPEAALTLQVRAARGAVEVPATVTIPAGQIQAQFPVRGLRAGVEELSLEPAEPRYAAAFARIQVQAQASALKLVPVSGDKQRVGPVGTVGEAIVARVVDVNNLPYPGVSVQASAGSGASVEPSTAVADAQGLVRFQWRPGAGSTRLRLSVGTAPGVVTEFSTSPGRPAIAPDGVVNAASYRYGLVPSGLATIWGSNLAGGSLPATAALPLPTELAGVRVLLNSQPVRLLYVSDSQINFVAPSSILGNSAGVLVEFQGAGAADRSDAAMVPVRFNDPGIFFSPSTNLAAALVGGTEETTETRPVAGGEVLEVFGTGLGAVVASSIPGLAETARRPVAILGGQEAEVLFSGSAPGFPGLYQVNVRVPAGLPPGPQTLIFRVDSNVSNETRVIAR